MPRTREWTEHEHRAAQEAGELVCRCGPRQLAQRTHYGGHECLRCGKLVLLLMVRGDGN